MAALRARTCGITKKARSLAELRGRMPDLPVIAYGNSEADLIHMYEVRSGGIREPPVPPWPPGLPSRGIRCVQWQ